MELNALEFSRAYSTLTLFKRDWDPTTGTECHKHDLVVDIGRPWFLAGDDPISIAVAATASSIPHFINKAEHTLKCVLAVDGL